MTGALPAPDDLMEIGDEVEAEMENDMTMTYVALRGGVLLLGGLAWFLLSDDKDKDKD